MPQKSTISEQDWDAHEEHLQQLIATSSETNSLSSPASPRTQNSQQRSNSSSIRNSHDSLKKKFLVTRLHSPAKASSENVNFWNDGVKVKDACPNEQSPPEISATTVSRGMHQAKSPDANGSSAKKGMHRVSENENRRRAAVSTGTTSSSLSKRHTTGLSEHQRAPMSPVSTRRNALHSGTTTQFLETSQTSPNAVRSINSFEEVAQQQHALQPPSHQGISHQSPMPGSHFFPSAQAPAPVGGANSTQSSHHHWPPHLHSPSFHSPIYSPYSYLHPYAFPHYPPYGFPPQHPQAQLETTKKQSSSEVDEPHSPLSTASTQLKAQRNAQSSQQPQDPREKPLFVTLTPSKAVLKFQPRIDNTFKLSIHCSKGIYVHHSVVPKGTNPQKWNSLIKKIFFENEVDPTLASSLPPSSCGFSWDEDKVSLSIWLRDDVLNEKYEWKLKLRPTMKSSTSTRNFVQEHEEDLLSEMSSEDSLGGAPHAVDKLMHSIFRVNNDVKKWQEKKSAKSTQLHHRLKNQRRGAEASDTISEDASSVQNFASMDVEVKKEFLMMHDTITELDRDLAQLKFDMHRQFTVFSSAFRENVDELRETVADMRSTALGLFQKCNELRDDMSMTSQSLQDHVTTTTMRLQQDIKQHREFINELLSENQNLRKRMKQLTITTDTRFKDLNERLSSKADISVSEKHLSDTREEMHIQLRKLSEKVDSMESTFVSEQEQRQRDISREVTNVQELRKDVEDRMVHLQNDIQNNLTLKNRKNETHLVNEIMKQNKQLKENVAVLTKRLETKDADYSSLQKQMHQMESKMDSINSKLEEEQPRSTNQLEQQLRTQTDMIRELKAQLDVIQGDIVPLQSDNLNIKKKIFDLGVNVQQVSERQLQEHQVASGKNDPSRIVPESTEKSQEKPKDPAPPSDSEQPSAELLHFHWSGEKKQLAIDLDRLLDGAPVVRCIPRSSVRHPMSILGNFDLEENQCYEWRLRVKEWDDKYRLWVGICDPRFSFSNYIGFFERSWSFELKEGKIFNGPTEKNYSKKHIGVGTVVSVIVDLRQSPGKIGFAIDGEWQGIAFNNVTLPVLPALSFEGDATIAS